jgi:hypothetical protein
MTFKLIYPLKTRHVEGWAEYINDNKVHEKSHPASEAIAVRQAVKFGWFDGDQPDVDEMEPMEVIKLAEMVYKAYSASLGFDVKK